MNVYHITLRGQIDVEDLNCSSPHHMTPWQAQTEATVFILIADQSGLLGLIRHLHNMGLEIASIICQNERKEP